MTTPSEPVLGITVDAVTLRLPRPLSPGESGRIGVLIEDAEQLLADELAVVGRDLADDLLHRPGFAGTARRVVYEMISAVVLVGANAGQRSASSTTGAQSDSVTWADTDGSRWGQLVLTDDQRSRLGLTGAQLPRGRFSPSRIRRWVR